MYTAEGRWKHSGQAWTHWCDGFLPGMMWYSVGMWLPTASGCECWLRASNPLQQAARAARRRIAMCMTSDLSFCPPITAGSHDAGSGVAGRGASKQARTLAQRFKENGQYLRSFVAEDSMFIDIMMNVGIIFYAARETGDQRLRDDRHAALRSPRAAYLVRGDGSTAHEGIFDLETGEFLQQSTQQGFRGDSCWSRGLAWSLVRLRHLLRIQPRSAFSAYGRSVRRLLHPPHLRPTECRRGITMLRPRIGR